ncbi:hypothetical protein LINGRAHAP2_LOCUS9980, partial [Linum grandiflorum]
MTGIGKLSGWNGTCMTTRDFNSTSCNGRDVGKIMFNLRRPDPKDDFFTYNGPEVKCDCGMRASRLMTPKFERYFACPKWRCKFDKKLEVVAAENSVRWEMKATMREKLAELEARKDAEMAELEVATTAKLSLKDGYIKELEHKMEVMKNEVRLIEIRNENLQRRTKKAEEEYVRYRYQ